MIPTSCLSRLCLRVFLQKAGEKNCENIWARNLQNCGKGNCVTREFFPRKERLDYKLAKMWFVGKGESRFPRTRGCRLPLFLHSKSDLTIPAWARTHLVYCRSYRMGCVRDRMARDRDRARDRSLRDFLAVFR